MRALLLLGPTDEGNRVHEDDLRTHLRAGLYTALLDTGTTSAFARRALDVLRDLCGPRPLGLALLEDGRATLLAAADADVAACDEAASRPGPGSRAALAEVATAAHAHGAPGVPDGGELPPSPVRTGLVAARPTPTGASGDASGTAGGGRPGWQRAMAAAGFTQVTVLAAPVRPGTDLLVTWYHRAGSAHATGPVTWCVQELTRSVALRLQTDQQATDNADLLAAMTSRATIDHAIGVLMAVHHCSADEATKRLREAARRKNVKMRDLASSLVRDVTGSSPTVGSPFRSRPGGGAGKPLA